MSISGSSPASIPGYQCSYLMITLYDIDYIVFPEKKSDAYQTLKHMLYLARNAGHVAKSKFCRLRKFVPGSHDTS